MKSFWENLTFAAGIPAKKSPIWDMSFDQLAEVFTFEIEKGNPNVDVLAPIQKNLAALIENENWTQVSDLIENYDSARATLPSGMTLTRLLLDRSWDVALGQALPEYDQASGASVSPYVLPETFIAPYIAAAAAHPERYGLQCLAAWMHLKMAWIRRGAAMGSATTDAQFEGCTYHVKSALHLIDGIDAAASNSPLAAEIGYRCEAVDGDLDLPALETAHAAWVALNPNDMSAFSLHGVFVLPRWFGSYEVLAQTALSAHTAHHEQSGLATYAATYLGAMDLDQKAMIGMDMARFKDGLVDLVSQAKDPAAALNGVCAHLSEICAKPYPLPDEKRDAKAIWKCKKTLKAILRKFIRDGMGTVTPALWTPHWGELEVPFVLAEAFEAEILAGQHVHLDHAGAAITQP